MSDDFDTSKTNLDTFTKRLRYIRKARKNTRLEIAFGSGIPEERLANIEYGKKGTNATPDEIVRLAKFFNVSLEWFMCVSDEQGEFPK